MAGLLHAVSGNEAAESRADVANLSSQRFTSSKPRIFSTRGQYAEAEGYFREVLRISPDHPGALNNLGTAVWRQKRHREAEEYHRRALVLASR